MNRASFFVPCFISAALIAACGSDSPTGTGTTGGQGGSDTSSSSSSGSNVSSGSSSGQSSSSGSGSSSSGAGGAGGMSMGSGGNASQDKSRYFPDGAVWYKDVSQDPVAADSAAITQWMEGFKPPNGWGTGVMKVDFSIVAVDVPANTPKRTYTTNGEYYVPDCDLAPVPVPTGGAVEETYGTPTDLSGPFTGYSCGDYAGGADCHMLFVSRSEKRLYEIYRGTIDGNNMFEGGCLAIWDLSKVYGVDGRGQQCTSADAAGFPIAPLLFTAEEIKAGVINHAIRFILPNNMIRTKKYVSPATHGTNTTGPATSVPYGSRLRLRADYPLNTLSPAAQVVAKALQKYGMLHADGGNIALTAQSDLLSDVKWADVGFDANSLADLKATDFEVLSYGVPFDVTYDCQRQQIIE